MLCPCMRARSMQCALAYMTGLHVETFNAFPHLFILCTVMPAFTVQRRLGG